jgi:hypothetical protein
VKKRVDITNGMYERLVPETAFNPEFNTVSIPEIKPSYKLDEVSAVCLTSDFI